MFLLALLHHENSPPWVIVVAADEADILHLSLQLPMDAAVILQEPIDSYPLKNNKTTFYVCHGHSCLPPANDLSAYDLAGRVEH